MDTTFISIHDLTDRATILYSSDSVVDILGYTPDDIVNRSAWDFFPEDELPYAREFQQHRVSTDKAAVLAYCRVRHQDGQWIGCECCFTIVYDVMVVCTSVYGRGIAAEKRAAEAPMVRRIFSSSPKDPRYHMLSHISAKFAQPSKPQLHEPRAALFLNRFTRTLSIMYATSGLQEVIGIPADEMRGRSFYYCIAENCLSDAVKCLENAKGNDSIAYLRFWFRDPRLHDQNQGADDSDEEMTTDMSEDQSEGGVYLQDDLLEENNDYSHDTSMDVDSDEQKTDSRHSSGDSMRPSDTHEAIFGRALSAESSHSSVEASPDRERRSPSRRDHDHIELEAVISCTSDGLVVCLRRARPLIPHPTHRPSRPVYENGLFAAPWATEPVLPPVEARAGAGFGPAFAPALGPQGARASLEGVRSPIKAGGPDHQDFMAAIRDQAIFAWALTGINGSLAKFSSGKPRGESMPADGFPVWASDSQQANGGALNGGENGGVNGRHHHTHETCATPAMQNGRLDSHFFGDPGLRRDQSSAGRSSTTSQSNSSGGTPYPR